MTLTASGGGGGRRQRGPRWPTTFNGRVWKRRLRKLIGRLHNFDAALRQFSGALNAVFATIDTRRMMGVIQILCVFQCALFCSTFCVRFAH